MKLLIKIFSLALVALFLTYCGGNKKQVNKVKKDSTVVKDTTRESTHQLDYEKFKGTSPTKKTPEQIIHF